MLATPGESSTEDRDSSLRFPPGTLPASWGPAYPVGRSTVGENVTIELDHETEGRLRESIVEFFREELELDIGDLKSSLVLRFVLEEIGPSVYNRAIFDVRSHLSDVVDEIDGVCFEPEFQFWTH